MAQAVLAKWLILEHTLTEAEQRSKHVVSRCPLLRRYGHSAIGREEISAPANESLNNASLQA